MQTNEKRFREVERRAADVIEAITHTGLKYDESEVSVDMCQAIQEMRMEERRIGEQDGELKKAKEAAGKMLADGILTLEKIAEYAGLSLEEVIKLKTE